MEKLEEIYNGNTKTFYKTENPDLLVMSYNNLVVVDEDKRENVEGKARFTNLLNNQIYKLLESNSVPTHFSSELNETETLVKKASPIPLKVKVRNYSAGSFTEKTGIQEGVRLKTPVLEFIYKDKKLKEPMLNGYYILALELASNAEIDKIVSYAFKVNELLIDYFGKYGLDLIDCKMEFGRCHGDIILIDSISLDSCRLWDKETHERLDADRLRLNLGNLSEAYMEVARRIAL